MTPQPGNARVFANWPEALINPAAFAREQTALSRVWTFLGLTRDVAQDGDWFRTTLATREVFVQRFGDALRCFENRCAHRAFPLRTADKGNGPIVCGFHGWRYDKDGRAVGIPECERVFGVAPEEMLVVLRPIEVATCGGLVFGRFRDPGDDETLEQFLGDGFPILEAMTTSPEVPRLMTAEVKANWRLCFHISVEDYHAPTVHADTFGKEGYLKPDEIGYHRFGRHSAFFTHRDPGEFAKMAAACRQGAWRSINYRVFHIFPNLTVSHFRTFAEHFHIVILQYAPVAPDRSAMRAWVYSSPFPPANAPGWHDRWSRPAVAAALRRTVPRFAAKVMREDNRVCEEMQANAVRLDAAPLLGALEERIGWFEEAYAAATEAAVDHVH